MALQFSSSLDPGITDLADLIGVELLPLFVIHLLIEGFNELGVHKVEE